jgi:hypothetical protein
MSGHLVTGAGPGLATCGYPGVGSCRHGKPLCGCRATGCAGPEAGCGSRATGSKLPSIPPNFLEACHAADNLCKASFSLGSVSALDDGRTIWIADAHRGDGKPFFVRADEKLTAFVEWNQRFAVAFVKTLAVED